MSSMLSSPSKQAQQAGSGSQGFANTDTAAAERYVNSQEQNLRNAIPSSANNPYMTAGAGLSPGQMPTMTPPGSITGISPNQIPASTGNPFTNPSQPTQPGPQPRMQPQ